MAVDVMVKAVDGLPDGMPVPFVEPVASKFRCGLCNHVTGRPMSDQGGHIFCPSCTDILTDAEDMFTCAVCSWRGRKGLLSESREVGDAVGRLLVLCPKNCSFKSSLEEFKEHFKYCGAAQHADAQDASVLCPLCKVQVLKKNLGVHISNLCAKRIASCPYCHCDIAISDVELHKLACDCRPATCEFCMERFQTYRQLRQEHLARCPHMPGPCSYEPFGCTFQGTPDELRKHEAQTSHADRLHKRYQQMEVSLKDGKKLFCEENERLRTVTDELFAKNVELEGEVRQLQAQLDQKSRETAEMCARYEDHIRGLQDQVKKTEEKVGACQQSFHAAMKDLALVSPEFRHIWKIQPYKHLRRATAAAENKNLNSTVVSTGSPGYRFMFSCNLTGAHLAVSMKIHCGEDDDILPWPFTGRIIVTLKSQTEPENDIDKVINPRNPEIADCFKKPESCGYNSRFGFTEFVRIPVLENERRGYLAGDCIVLQFTIFPSADLPQDE